MIFAGCGPDGIFSKNKPLVLNMTEVVTFEKPDGRGKGGQLVLKGALAMNLPGTLVEESKYMYY